MNMLEAIATGLPFKREGWHVYYRKEDFDFIPMKDILSDDWEVEEIIIPVTNGTFDVAWQRAESKQPAGKWLAVLFKDTLKKELGL